MHGDNIRKAIKKAQHGNEVRKGVNEYGKTAWNSWMKKEYPMENAMKTDKNTKHVKKSGATPGETVKRVKDKQNKKNALTQGRNDHKKVTGGEPNEDANIQPFGSRDKSLGGKKRFGAGMGGGSEPSGTNTHISKDKFTRRPDGSMPNC